MIAPPSVRLNHLSVASQAVASDDRGALSPPAAASGASNVAARTLPAWPIGVIPLAPQTPSIPILDQGNQKEEDCQTSEHLRRPRYLQQVGCESGY